MIKRRIIESVIKIINRFSHKNYITYSIYDKNPTESAKRFSAEKIGIIIQGPWVEKDNFTLNTIKFYSSCISENDIIVYSGWSNEREHVEKLVDRKNVKLIFNDKPKNSGFRNINLQVVSTSQAIKHLSSKGCKMILKTRSDQRFYCMNNLEGLISLCRKKRDKLLISSFNTFSNRIYSVSDMFMMGYTQKMVEYWDIPLDKRPPEDFKIPSDLNDIAYAKMRCAEQYYLLSFLERQNHFLEFTTQDYYDVLDKFFYIIDSSTLKLFWPKYTFMENRWELNNNITSLNQFSYLSWLAIKSKKCKVK